MSKTASFPQMFIRFVALPLLFIAGVQLYILTAHTDVYFAWTIALPLTAAFLGAGYWAAMIAAYMSWWQPASMALRLTGLTSVAATGILGVATFVHLDKFHLASPALITQFVTWVWILVYVGAPFLFLWLWLTQGRTTDETMGAMPLPRWVRQSYLFQVVLLLPAGFLLFLVPASIIPFWAWKLTPLTARAISAWLVAYGVACVAVNRENNFLNTRGVRASLLAFCVLQLVALARFFSSFDLTKPLAWVYVLILLVGVIASMPGLLSSGSE